MVVLTLSAFTECHWSRLTISERKENRMVCGMVSEARMIKMRGVKRLVYRFTFLIWKQAWKRLS